MADFTKVTGFYIAIGSKDMPKTWSPTEPFGFDSADTGYSSPVFESCMYDVLNVFKSPISAMRKFSITGDIVSNYISQLIFGEPVQNFDSSTVSEDSSDNRWITALMILDYLFINQDVDTLVSDFNTDVASILGDTRKDHYVDSSLIIDISDDGSRINYVSFVLNHGTEGDDVTYKIYFNPDLLLANESGDRKKVFLYEDLSGDDYINLDEWKSQIIQKHLNIFEDARYTNYKTLSTNYVDTDPTKPTVQHHFFVYSLTELTTADITNAIKEYLLTEPRSTPEYDGHVLTLPECMYHYPDLFTENKIYIYPVDQTQVGDSNSFSSPVSINKFRTILDHNEVEVSNSNYSNAELFFIGSEDANIVYNIPFSAVAVNEDIDSNLKPISGLFSDYTPIYSSIDFENEQNDSKKFHKLIRLAISVIYETIAPDHPSVTDISDAGINFAIESIEGEYKVTFDFVSTTFVVKKP